MLKQSSFAQKLFGSIVIHNGVIELEEGMKDLELVTPHYKAHLLSDRDKLYRELFEHVSKNENLFPEA